jgi:hypothetical protein
MEWNGKNGISADADFKNAWNALGKPFSQIAVMTETRRKLLKTRLGDAFFRDNWKRALELLPQRAFCKGENDRGWIADPEFFLRPDTVTKIIEGTAYLGRRGSFQNKPGEGAGRVRGKDWSKLGRKADQSASPTGVETSARANLDPDAPGNTGLVEVPI